MKIKNGFIMREIAGEYIIVPTGKAAVDFNGLITVNEVGRFLWTELQEETSENKLVDRVLEEYEIDKNTVALDVREFIEKLQTSGILEN